VNWTATQLEPVPDVGTDVGESKHLGLVGLNGEHRIHLAVDRTVVGALESMFFVTWRLL
jgi:hypothetical protein